LTEERGEIVLDNMPLKISQVALCSSLLVVALLLGGCSTPLCQGDCSAGSGGCRGQHFNEKTGERVWVQESGESLEYVCGHKDSPKDKDGNVRQWTSMDYTGPEPLVCGTNGNGNSVWVNKETKEPYKTALPGVCTKGETHDYENPKKTSTLYEVSDKVWQGVSTTTSVPFVMMAALGLAGLALFARRFIVPHAVAPSGDMELDSRLDIE